MHIAMQQMLKVNCCDCWIQGNHSLVLLKEGEGWQNSGGNTGQGEYKDVI